MKTYLLCGFTTALALSSLSTANADVFGIGDSSFEIEFRTIGDANNRADEDPRATGSVPYSYAISKYEIPRQAVQLASDAGGLMLRLSTREGLQEPDFPATGITWNETARFVNWLNESRGFPHAYKFATQPRDADYAKNESVLLWNEVDAGFDPENPLRNAMAQYAMPTEDEWYKAAFYDPFLDHYFTYATGSGLLPTAVAGGTDPGSVVYAQFQSVLPALIDNAGGLSRYGVMALTGNVTEWNEARFPSPELDSLRLVAGCSWGCNADGVVSSFRTGYFEDDWSPAIGIRVVSIPEPHGWILGLIALGLTLLRRRRRD